MSFLHHSLKALIKIPRTVVIALEGVVMVGVLMALLLTVALFQLARGPIDIGFVKPYLENALSRPDRLINVTLERAVLKWPDLQGPIQLDVNAVQVKENNQTIATVRDASIAVSKLPLLWGQVRPERLIVRSPAIMFIRSSDNRLGFQLIDDGQVAANNISVSSSILGLLFGDQKDNNTLLSRINEVVIQQARISVVDHVLGTTWRLKDVDLRFNEAENGVLGTLIVRLPNNQSLNAQLTYQRERDALSIQAAFQDFSFPSFIGRLIGAASIHQQHLPLTGTVNIQAGLQPLNLRSLAIEAKGKSGVLDWVAVPGLSVPVDDVALAMTYTPGAVGWNIERFDFNLAGVPVRSSVSLTPNNQGGYQGDLAFQIAQLPQDVVADFWPPAYRAIGAGEWITHKLSGAEFRDLKMTVPLAFQLNGRQLSAQMMMPRATFAFANLRADYLSPLMPVMDAAGTGLFENDKLTLNVTEGKVGDLSLATSTIILSDLTKKGAGHADLDITLNGPLPSMLAYIARPPIDMPNPLPIDEAKVKGSGTYRAIVSFPTLKDLPKDQVKADVTATLNDLQLPGLVMGQTLAGGPFEMMARAGMIDLKGTGTLSGQPIELTWQEPVTPKKGTCATAQATIQTSRVGRQAITTGLDFIDGLAPVGVVYKDCSQGPETAKVTVDLTPARINFQALHYEKAPGLKATAALSIVLKNGALEKADALSVTAPGFKIKNGTLRFGKMNGAENLIAAAIPAFEVGFSRGSISYRRQADRMEVDIKGSRFDLKPYLSVKGNDDNEVTPVAVTATVDQLSFGGVADMAGAKLRVALNAQADIAAIELSGTAGKGPASMTYVPDEKGRMTLDVKAEDAGGFLRVLDVYDNMQGGTLRLVAAPIGSNNRDVKGDLVIRDFSVIKAPVLAQMLSALSIKGLGEQLGNQGIGFKRLESGFALLRRTGQDVMSFRDGRTSGSALGLTFDGIYDRGKGNIDIQGTIIPVSGVNTLASKIPVLGRLLTGGEGQGLFAATYAVSGPADKPKTMINPLSVLTPGIFRKMFFEDLPSEPQAEKPPRGVNN